MGLESSDVFSNLNDSTVLGATAVGFSSHSAFVLLAVGSALRSGCLGRTGQRLVGTESLPGVLVLPPGAKLSYFVILLYSLYLISLRSAWGDVGAGMCLPRASARLPCSQLRQGWAPTAHCLYSGAHLSTA